MLHLKVSGLANSFCSGACSFRFHLDRRPLEALQKEWRPLNRDENEKEETQTSTQASPTLLPTQVCSRPKYGRILFAGCLVPYFRGTSEGLQQSCCFMLLLSTSCNRHSCFSVHARTTCVGLTPLLRRYFGDLATQNTEGTPAFFLSTHYWVSLTLLLHHPSCRRSSLYETHVHQTFTVQSC